MDAKICILVLCTLQYANAAGLLRTPKVYNALITTDENLTPSRAFPLIQPTIHETGIATFPYGFPAYRFVNPSLNTRFGPSGNGLVRNLPGPDQPPLEPPQNHIPELGPGPLNLPPRAPEGPLRPPFPLPNQPQQPVQPLLPSEGRPPFPLNEFGLPPSLVPLPQFPRPPHHPVNLQPFPFNHYPLIYDQFHQFPDQYLPPFGYYPPPTGFGIFPTRPPPNQNKKPESRPSEQVVPELNAEKPAAEAPAQPEQPMEVNTASPESLKVQPASQNGLNLDGIKNISPNRNSDVPDVPPPPIPSGAKVAK